jgi:peptidoglycan/xylan/chitin deacetylase (PgdA/CDA1 family)
MFTELLIVSPLLLGCLIIGTWWFGLITVAAIGTVWWLPKSIFIDGVLGRYFPTVVTRIIQNENPKKMVYLTFDDVPYPSGGGTSSYSRLNCTQKIFNYLNMYDAKGTFFVISDYLNQDQEHYDTLAYAVRDGHELGNHGKTNSMHLMKYLLGGQNVLRDEIEQCQHELDVIYDSERISPDSRRKPLNVYRPGCGLFGNGMLNFVQDKLGFYVVLGSVYPNDPIVRSAKVNFEYLKQHITSGDIVILHDREWTVDLLEMLLPWLRSEGYQMRTLRDME